MATLRPVPLPPYMRRDAPHGGAGDAAAATAYCAHLVERLGGKPRSGGVLARRVLVVTPVSVVLLDPLKGTVKQFLELVHIARVHLDPTTATCAIAAKPDTPRDDLHFKWLPDTHNTHPAPDAVVDIIRAARAAVAPAQHHLPVFSGILSDGVRVGADGDYGDFWSFQKLQCAMNPAGTNAPITPPVPPVPAFTPPPAPVPQKTPPTVPGDARVGKAMPLAAPAAAGGEAAEAEDAVFFGTTSAGTATLAPGGGGTGSGALRPLNPNSPPHRSRGLHMLEKTADPRSSPSPPPAPPQPPLPPTRGGLPGAEDVVVASPLLAAGRAASRAASPPPPHFAAAATTAPKPTGPAPPAAGARGGAVVDMRGKPPFTAPEDPYSQPAPYPGGALPQRVGRSRKEAAATAPVAAGDPSTVRFESWPPMASPKRGAYVADGGRAQARRPPQKYHPHDFGIHHIPRTQTGRSVPAPQEPGHTYIYGTRSVPASYATLVEMSQPPPHARGGGGLGTVHAAAPSAGVGMPVNEYSLGPRSGVPAPYHNPLAADDPMNTFGHPSRAPGALMFRPRSKPH